MLSRVASSMYWMSRYLERADNVARFIEVNSRLIMDMGWNRKEAQWAPLVHASGDDHDFNTRYGEHSEKNVMQFLTFDKKNPNSIVSCIQYARENARTVREIISSEMWECINGLYHFVEKHSRKRKVIDLQDFFKHVQQTNQLFNGQSETTMSQGEGWHFSRIGRLLERADKTARILDMKYFILLPDGEVVDSPYDTVEWGAVLKSVSGFEMYRKQFHRANHRDVTQFLILDEDFPRAIRFCIRTASRSLFYLTQMLNVKVEATQAMIVLRESLEDANIESILCNGLHEFIDEIQLKLNAIDDAIYQSFFAFDKK